MARVFRTIISIGLFWLISVTSLSQESTPPNRPIITADNIDALQEILTLEHDFDSIPTLTWSSDGRWLVGTGLGGINLYDLTNGLSQTIDTTPLLIEGGATFSPDGRILATAGFDYVVLWDIQTGAQLGLVRTPYPPEVMQFNHDGTVLAITANGDLPSETVVDTGTVYLWDVESITQYGTVGFYDLITRSTQAIPFIFGTDGETLLTLRDGAIHGWDYRTPENNRPSGLMPRAELITFLEDNYQHTPRDATPYMWVAYQHNTDTTFALWLSAEDGSALFSTQTGDVMTVTPNQAGNDFDDAGIPQTINDYTRLERAELIQSLSTLQDLSFPTFGDPVTIINRQTATAVIPRYAYNPDTNSITDRELNLIFMGVEQSGVGRFISADGDVLLQRYYALDTPATEPDLLYTLENVDHSRFTSDGYLFTLQDGDDDRATVRLIDPLTSEIRFELTLSAWDGVFKGVALHPDQSLLFYGIYDDITELRGINVVDTQTGQGIMTLPYQGDALSFNHNGSLLAFRSADSPLSLWGIPQ